MAKKINVHVATSMTQAAKMKREGKEPIVARANEREVCVFVRSEDIAQVLWDDASWHMSEPQNDGYQKFTYTRLNVQEIMAVLSGQTD